MEQAMAEILERSAALHSLVITLSLAQKATIPATLGRALHAQVMDWIQQGNPDLATQVHDAQTSPLVLSGLQGARRRRGASQAGDQFWFRVTLLDDALLSPLLQGIEAQNQPKISLGKCPFVMRELLSLPGSHDWVGSSSYELLAKTSIPCHQLKLQFLSPTSFKQQQQIQPFLLPKLVFNSLWRRWNNFAPIALQFPTVEWKALVTAYDLKTQALKMEGGPEIGSQGWVRYRFPDLEQARIATILANFAFFAGVGRKTSMGMGQTRLLAD
jgi:CRISPR-associated endoribonuclease Cas6